MLDIMPLPLFCEMTAVYTVARLHKILDFDWDGAGRTKRFSTSHMKYWTDLLDSADIPLLESDECDERIDRHNYVVNTVNSWKFRS